MTRETLLGAQRESPLVDPPRPVDEEGQERPSEKNDWHPADEFGSEGDE